MDDRRFDELAKTLAGAASRRSVLKGSAGTAIAGAFALVRGSSAGAKNEKVTICHKPGTPAQKTMEVPSSAVGGHTGHGDHVGPCCPANQLTCVNPGTAAGTCCPATTNPCAVTACNGDGTCGLAPANAGAVCGPAADACSDPPTCTGSSTTCPLAASECSTDEVCVDGECQGTLGLGEACAASQQCQSDLCCPPGTPRAGLCGVDDGGECPGGSNNACCSGTCVEGTCQPAPGGVGATCDPGDEADCAEPLTCCDNTGPTGPDFVCTDTNTDPGNCGACATTGGDVCTENETCVDGDCVCTGGPASTCTDLSCCPPDQICGPGNVCSPPLGTGSDCAENQDCASGLCCPAGTPRQGLCGIATGQPCPVNSGSPSNNSCCSGSCVFDEGSTTTATCRERQPIGGTCDVGDAADCQDGLSCCDGFCRSTTTCSVDTDCCSGICDDLTGQCVAAPGLAACAACAENGDCASGTCSGGTCAPAQTLPAGWIEQTSGTGADVSIVCGPGTPPLGATSAQLTVGANGNNSAQLRTGAYAGTLLSDLETLTYSTYVQGGGSGGQAPYIILNVDLDGNGTTDDQLFFEPVYQTGAYSGDPVPNQGNVAVGTWQTWDARNGGWWSLNASTFGPPLVTLNSYIAANPNARIAATAAGGVRIVTGFGAGAWDNFVGNVDNVTIDTASTSASTTDF